MVKPRIEINPALTDRNLHQLATLIENADKLKLLEQASENLTPDRSPDALAKIISEKSGLSTDAVNNIIEFSVAMAEISETYEFKFSEIFDGLSLAISDQAPLDWKKKYEGKWKKNRKKIEAFLETIKRDNPIQISNKASRLTLQHQHVLTKFEILTDLRPVYNSDGDQVLESLVTHKAIIEYRKGRSNEVMHFAIDNKDLEAIKLACERAYLKTQTLRTALEGVWPVRIIGESNDD